MLSKFEALKSSEDKLEYALTTVGGKPGQAFNVAVHACYLPGRPYRDIIPDDPKQRGNKNGICCFFNDHGAHLTIVFMAAGGSQVRSHKETVSISLKDGSSSSRQNKSEIAQQKADLKKQNKIEDERVRNVQLRRKKYTQDLLSKAPRVQSTTYTKKKKLPDGGLDGKGWLVLPWNKDALIIPMVTIEERHIWDFQVIYGDGTKRFHPGFIKSDADKVPMVENLICPLGDGEADFITEGAANGLSGYLARDKQKTTWIAFSSHKLADIAQYVPKSIIISDREANGITGAKAAFNTGHPFWASDINGEDASDIWVKHGKKALAKSLSDFEAKVHHQSIEAQTPDGRRKLRREAFKFQKKHEKKIIDADQKSSNGPDALLFSTMQAFPGLIGDEWLYKTLAEKNNEALAHRKAIWDRYFELSDNTAQKWTGKKVIRMAYEDPFSIEMKPGRVLFGKMPKGWGKTQKLGKSWLESARRLGLFSLLINPRRELSRAVANMLDIDCYLDIGKANDIEPLTHENIMAMVLCCCSLDKPQFQPIIHATQFAMLDEARKIRHTLRSTDVSSQNIFESFKEFMGTLKQGLILDADLADADIDFYGSLLPKDVEIIIVEVSEKKKDKATARDIEIINGKDRNNYLLSYIDQQSRSNNHFKPWIASNNKKQITKPLGRILKKIVRDTGKKENDFAVIHADNPKETKDIRANPNKMTARLQGIVTSPSWGEGVSIEHKEEDGFTPQDRFTDTFFMASGNIGSPQNLCQAIERVRYNTKFSLTLPKGSEDEIVPASREDTKHWQEVILKRDLTDWEQFKQAIDDEDRNIEAYFDYFTVEMLKRTNSIITYHENGEEFLDAKTGMKQAREEIYEESLSSVQTAQAISSEQFDRLKWEKQNGNADTSELAMIEAFGIRQTFNLLDEAPITKTAYDLYKGGKIRSPLNRLRLFLGCMLPYTPNDWQRQRNRILHKALAGLTLTKHVADEIILAVLQYWEKIREELAAFGILPPKYSLKVPEKNRGKETGRLIWKRSLSKIKYPRRLLNETIKRNLGIKINGKKERLTENKIASQITGIYYTKYTPCGTRNDGSQSPVRDDVQYPYMKGKNIPDKLYEKRPRLYLPNPAIFDLLQRAVGDDEAWKQLSRPIKELPDTEIKHDDTQNKHVLDWSDLEQRQIDQSGIDPVSKEQATAMSINTEPANDDLLVIPMEPGDDCVKSGIIDRGKYYEYRQCIDMPNGVVTHVLHVVKTRLSTSLLYRGCADILIGTIYYNGKKASYVTYSDRTVDKETVTKLDNVLDLPEGWTKRYMKIRKVSSL